MRVEVIDMEQTKNEAKKYILKKIPLVSKVFQFNSVIGDIKLEYIEFKVLIYEVISKKKNNKIFSNRFRNIFNFQYYIWNYVWCFIYS